VNEVFFDNVKVPVENRVGEENKGWTYAKFLLVNERSGIAAVARSRRSIEKVREMASTAPPGSSSIRRSGPGRNCSASTTVCRGVSATHAAGPRPASPVTVKVACDPSGIRKVFATTARRPTRPLWSLPISSHALLTQ